MAGMVAPAADEVWGAVAVTSTADGLEETAPETDEEWERVRFQALQLAEASNLLMMEGRSVAGPEQTLLYEGLEGNLTADQIQTAIEANRTGFISFAQAFRNAAMESLAAIDARDTARLSDSGGGLDEACESCHATFWYPAAQ
jgi:cytochrome c556